MIAIIAASANPQIQVDFGGCHFGDDIASHFLPCLGTPLQTQAQSYGSSPPDSFSRIESESA
jgi:hypothetical protein